MSTIMQGTGQATYAEKFYAIKEASEKFEEKLILQSKLNPASTTLSFFMSGFSAFKGFLATYTEFIKSPDILDSIKDVILA